MKFVSKSVYAACLMEVSEITNAFWYLGSVENDEWNANTLFNKRKKKLAHLNKAKKKCVENIEVK